MFLLLPYYYYCCVCGCGIQIFNPPLFWASKLGIMADVEYEDYEIVKFPYFYEVLTNAPSEPVKLPTIDYSDFGFPANFHVKICDEPKCTLATEVCTAVLLAYYVVSCECMCVFFYEEIVCFFLSFLSREEMNFPPMHRCS